MSDVSAQLSGMMAGNTEFALIPLDSDQANTMMSADIASIEAKGMSFSDVGVLLIGRKGMIFLPWARIAYLHDKKELHGNARADRTF